MIAWAGAERLALGLTDALDAPPRARWLLDANARRRRVSPIPARVSRPRSGDMPSFNSVAVVGAGAWGTALATVAARAGRDVVLYARNAGRAAHIARHAVMQICPASGWTQALA